MTGASPSTSTSDGPGPYPESGRTAEPEPIVEAIERVEQVDEDTYGPDNPGSIASHYLPALDLPGFDGLQYDDCGDERAHICEDCGNVVGIGRTCKEWDCERCWKAAVLRAADGRQRDNAGIVARLEALRKEQYATTPENVNPKFHHFVISVPDLWAPAADDPVERSIEVIKDWLDELGVQGFLFAHPWRGEEEVNPHAEEPEPEPVPSYQGAIFDDEPAFKPGVATDQSADDRDQWKQRLSADREWQGDVRDELRLSWHFHVIGVGDFVKGDGLTDVVEDQTGWVMHRITREDSSVSIYDLDAAARAVMYCLSHTAIYDTPAGTRRALYRHHGRDLDGIDVYDKTDRAAMIACRKAAPKVLGMQARDLLCDVAYPSVEDVDGQAPDGVSATDAASATAQAAASSDGPPVDALPETHAGELPTSADVGVGELPDDGNDGGSGRSTLYVDGKRIEYEPCNGALLDVALAGDLVDDADWLAAAMYADDAVEAFEAFVEDADWYG